MVAAFAMFAITKQLISSVLLTKDICLASMAVRRFSCRPTASVPRTFNGSPENRNQAEASPRAIVYTGYSMRSISPSFNGLPGRQDQNALGQSETG